MSKLNRIKHPSDRARLIATTAMDRWGIATKTNQFGDLGWHSGGMLGQMIAFGGMPPRTGNDKSNLSQCVELDRMRQHGVSEACLVDYLLAVLASTDATVIAALRHCYTHEGNRVQKSQLLGVDREFYSALVDAGLLLLGFRLLTGEEKGRG